MTKPEAKKLVEAIEELIYTKIIYNRTQLPIHSDRVIEARDNLIIECMNVLGATDVQ